MSTPAKPPIVPVIDRLPVLPYWPVYSEWADHLAECRKCTETMTTGTGQVNDLCQEGRCLQTALQWDITHQREMAALN